MISYKDGGMVILHERYCYNKICLRQDQILEVMQAGTFTLFRGFNTVSDVSYFSTVPYYELQVTNTLWSGAVSGSYLLRRRNLCTATRRFSASLRSSLAEKAESSAVEAFV